MSSAAEVFHESPSISSAAPAGRETARELDKFYTKPAVARQCLSDFAQWTGIDLSQVKSDIIEPSAGAGAFLDLLPRGAIGYDIAPEHPDVVRADFLALSRRAAAIVIGNPPFGKAARLAVRFFNHAAGFASHIAFIVPRTFEKPSIQNRLSPQFHLVGERVLEPGSFTFEGEDYTVPCVFQVWERRCEPRAKIISPLTHPDFDFVTREQADFAVQRVGARAGMIKRDLSQIAAASHYFLRANRGVDEVIDRISAADFSQAKARNAGNPSISKAELVALYAEGVDGR